MPKYISADRIRLAVARLAESRARPIIKDWLIIKRGLKQAGAAPLSLGSKDPAHIGAIDGVVGTRLADPSEKPPFTKYINVFEATPQRNFGYLSNKFVSNGVATNVGSSSYLKLIVQVVSKDPMTVTLLPFVEDNFRSALLTGYKDRLLPLLDDLACWYFRGVDVAHFSEDGAYIMDALVNRFLDEFGITDEECEALFDTYFAERPVDSAVYVTGADILSEIERAGANDENERMEANDSGADVGSLSGEGDLSDTNEPPAISTEVNAT